MLSSVLLFVCVVLNLWLIWWCLARPLRSGINDLLAGFRATRRYFKCRLSERREQALRQRTLRLMRHLGVVIVLLIAIVLLYAPSMLLANYRSDFSAAFYAPEALAGMLVAAVVIGWRERRR